MEFVIPALALILLIWLVYDFGRHDEREALKKKAEEWIKEHRQD